MVTMDEVTTFAGTLPRSYEAIVRGRVKFRVGRIVWLAFSKDGSTMGFAFPKEWRNALVESDPEKFSLPSESDMRYHWAHVQLAALDERGDARARRGRLVVLRPEERRRGVCRHARLSLRNVDESRFVVNRERSVELPIPRQAACATMETFDRRREEVLRSSEVSALDVRTGSPGGAVAEAHGRARDARAPHRPAPFPAGRGRRLRGRALSRRDARRAGELGQERPRRRRTGRLATWWREPVHLEEVDPGDRAPILKRYLELAPGARAHFPVDRRAPLADFEATAGRYPVFRVRQEP